MNSASSFEAQDPSGAPGAADGQSGPQAGRGHTRDASRPRPDLRTLRQARLKDYAIRFVFGGTISVLAALIGQWTTIRFGGIFTAFPAILLASLTLIGDQDGREASAEDAEGGVAGALALAIAAALLAATLPHMSGAASLLASLLLWLLLAVGIYGLAVRLGWLRTTVDES